MRKSKGDKIFDGINVVFMALLCLVFIVPIIYVVSGSVMSEAEYLRRGQVLIPKHIDFGAYKIVFSSEFGLMKGFKDTLFITLLGTVCNVFFSACMAYALSKKNMPLRDFITGMVFFTMLFGGGLIPTYMLVRALGMMDHYSAFIVPGLISAWNMLLLRNFFMAIPQSLEEAALIDGASEIVVFLKIILPLSLPALATVGLFCAVGHWNQWFSCIIYSPKGKIQTIQYILRKILIDNAVGERTRTISQELAIPTYQVQMASLVVATAPIICVYPFIQKYFVKGVMVGSIKG